MFRGIIESLTAERKARITEKNGATRVTCGAMLTHHARLDKKLYSSLAHLTKINFNGLKKLAIILKSRDS